MAFGRIVLVNTFTVSLLYEWVADFTRTGEVKTVEKSRWNGKQRLTEHYRYINQVPLRNSDDALLVNGCEVTITNAKQDVVYRYIARH